MTVENLISIVAIAVGIALAINILNVVARQITNVFKGYGVKESKPQEPINVEVNHLLDLVASMINIPLSAPVAAQSEARTAEKIIRYIWERTPDCHQFRVNAAGMVSNITPPFENVTFESNGAMHFKLRLCKMGTFGFKNLLPEGVQLEALIAPEVIGAISAALMRDVSVEMSDDGQYLLLHVSGELKLKKNVLTTEEHDSEVGYVLGDDGELVQIDLFDDEAQR